MLISAIHALVIIFSYNVASEIAIAEALAFNGWLAILGTGVWYMVRYSNLQKRSVAELVFSHLSGVTALLLLWLLPLYPLMQFLFVDDLDYQAFLFSSITIRVITGTVIYATLASIVYLVLNTRALKAQQVRESELRNLLKESELNMLRFQINPHFLFNSLNAISSLIITRPTEANKMVLLLSDFMRYSLDFSGKVMSNLGKELDHCNQYLAIEQVRFGDRLKVDLNVEEQALDFPLPAMLLQPLVENAVKHGLNDIKEGAFVKIFAGVYGQTMRLEVINTIDNFDRSNRVGTGTGLKNIRSRLENIYGVSGLMEIRDNNAIFHVIINIPGDGRKDQELDN